MATEENVTQHLSRHFRILGACWMLYGFICLIAALWLIFFTNTATVMFGALLNRVPDPFSMMSDFHFFYGVLIVLSVVCGVLGVLAGLGLLAGQRFGSGIALIAAFLSLSSIPLGTTLGIYTLIILLPLSTWHTSAVPANTRSSSLRGQTVTP
jgi:hypothetical protein